MSQESDRFRMTKELGARLRSLRERAEMTQAALARAVGGNWDHALVSKLESGNYPNPGLGLVADYLRACRASFEDILDLLKEYTSKRSPVELAGRQAVVTAAMNLPERYAAEGLKYDAKVASARRAAGQEPLSPEERVKRMVKLVEAADRRQKLKVVTNELLSELSTPPGFKVRVFVERMARKVWGVMSRTRVKNQHMRTRRLARLVGEFAAEHVLPFSEVQLVRNRVVELFSAMDLTGKLPKPPAESQPRRTRQSKPVDPEFERRRDAMIARQANISEAMNEAMAALQPRELPNEQTWFLWIQELCSAAFDTLPGTPERERVVAEALPKSPDPAEAKEYAELAMSGLDRQLRRTGAGNPDGSSAVVS
jgi:transcriptional regulator with XRE-family HTH domain